MKEDNAKKLEEYIDVLKKKVGLDGFAEDGEEDEENEIPKPQYWSDIDAIEFDPDRWLIPNLVPREGVSMLASVSGEGKSLHVMHWCLCFATGAPLYGNPNLPVKKSKVLYVNLEMSVSEMQRRGRLMGFSSDDKNAGLLGMKHP